MTFFSQGLDMLRYKRISCLIDHLIAARREYFEMWADFDISWVHFIERVQWREMAVGINSDHFVLQLCATYEDRPAFRMMSLSNSSTSSVVLSPHFMGETVCTLLVPGSTK